MSKNLQSKSGNIRYLTAAMFHDPIVVRTRTGTLYHLSFDERITLCHRRSSTRSAFLLSLDFAMANLYSIVKCTICFGRWKAIVETKRTWVASVINDKT